MIRVTSFHAEENSWRDRYIKQIQKFIPFEWKEIPIRHCPDQRGSRLLPEEEKFLTHHREFYLVDQSGKGINSNEFYRWLFGSQDRHLIVGPAIGFHNDFKQKALGKISLSNLTLTHGLAQTVLAEALFRAVCQLKNHPFIK